MAKINTISLRSWWDIDHDKGLGKEINPIEEFIHANEPPDSVGGNQEEEFRQGIQEMIEYIYELAIEDAIQAVLIE